ncbi:hypothetical protein [Staphylococcus sp. IVB6233]|uniref:DUF6414 family protein n=1 Tax=Staphylococcus sp. IVB6233 TaxID=2989769 RepID=UPI0021D12AA4|nr:hypothetical protein [Staphylococcus sp. IVB6233]UXR75647.1 hypothetical protein MUA74_08225 [Staphylococcus sp. IVB6233]
MKDFIYIDTDAISSISAQLFEGNILELTDEQTEHKGENITDNYGTNESKETTGKLGSSGTGVAEKKENQSYESKSIEFTDNETFKIGVKKAYDDFLYNKVYDALKEKNEIRPLDDSNQFDFVDIDGEFTVLDIDTSSKIFDTELLRQMPFMDNSFELPSIESLNNKFKAATNFLEHPGNKKLPKQFKNVHELEEFHETFEGLSYLKTFNEMSKHLSTIFGNKIILYRGNTVLIGDRDHLRIPGETLSLANAVNINGFGRKITKTKVLSTVTNLQNVEFNNNEFLSKGTQSMLMIFISSILGLKEKDTFDIFQPIGLEYSKVSK